MPTEVILPKVDMDMATGVIAAWHVSEGERVEKSAPLFDIETDKAAMEVESPATGILGHVRAQAGAEVAIGVVVAWIYADGETIGDRPPKASDDAHKAADPVAETVGEAPVSPRHAEAPCRPLRKPRATPLARRIAKEAGIDLSTVEGTGPRGRVVKSDVIAAIEARTETLPANRSLSAPEPAAAAAPRTATDRPHEVIELDNMRRTIAARLTRSTQTVPHFYLRRDIRLDTLLDLRASLNRRRADDGLKISVNDFLIKACARALQKVPEANVSWADDRMLRFISSDISVAVALEDGLFTPIVRDAEKKTLSAISTEMKALAGRARDRKLQPHEYQGGAFAISNLGMFGVESFDAIINPPQSSILAAGIATQRPVVSKEGRLDVATVMSVTLSVDHRAIDGALGARFLDAIVEGLEAPCTMLV